MTTIELEREVKSLQEKNDILTEKIKRMEDDSAKKRYDAYVSDIKRECETKIASARQMCVDYACELERHAIKIKHLEKEVELSMQNYNKLNAFNIEELKAIHEKNINELKNKYDKVMIEMKKSHDLHIITARKMYLFITKRLVSEYLKSAEITQLIDNSIKTQCKIRPYMYK